MCELLIKCLRIRKTLTKIGKLDLLSLRLAFFIKRKILLRFIPQDPKNLIKTKFYRFHFIFVSILSFLITQSLYKPNLVELAIKGDK